MSDEPERQASAPDPNAAGGFNWGLRPRESASVPEAPAVVPTPPPLETPPEPVVPVPVVPEVVVPVPEPVAPSTTSAVPEPVAAVPWLVEGPPTEPYVPEPTQPLTWNEFAATQQHSAPPSAVKSTLPIPPIEPVAPSSPLDEATQAYTVQPWQPAAASEVPGPADVPEEHPVDTAEPTSAIDSLFGDHKFQDYQEVGVLAALQTAPGAAPVEGVPVERAPRAPLTGTQKALMGVAAGLIGVLILIAMFFLGQHLGSAQAATPKPHKTGSVATPTPAGTGGPAAPGVQQWTALQGGECIQPFSSAWAQTFTVVACSADHDAEMVFKGKLPDASNEPYPTAASFQKQLIGLCSAPTAINYGAAAAVTDLQISFSYPPNTAAWLAGDRTYYCFVDRVSGGNLPGDLSVAKSTASN